MIEVRDAERPLNRPLEVLLPLLARTVLQRPVGAESIRGLELLVNDEHPCTVELEGDRALVVEDVSQRLAREDPDAMVPLLRRLEQRRRRGLEGLDRRHPSLVILMPYLGSGRPLASASSTSA